MKLDLISGPWVSLKRGMRGASFPDELRRCRKADQADDSPRLWRAALLLWICAACSLAFIACGVKTPRASAAIAAKPEPAVAAHTLEATLQMPNGIDEMPFYPEIARNVRGDVVAVWEQFDGEQYSIWGNSRPVGRDWGRATLLEAHQSGHAYGPRLALNAYGSAMAVWVQANHTTGTRTVRSSHLEIETGWSAVSPVDRSSEGLASSPQVAIDDRGHVTASWQQGEGSQRASRANRYRPGSGWGKAAMTSAELLQPLGN